MQDQSREYGQQFFSLPHDVVTLPSEGKFYKNKKKSIKVGYLTASDEKIVSESEFEKFLRETNEERINIINSTTCLTDFNEDNFKQICSDFKLKTETFLPIYNIRKHSSEIEEIEYRHFNRKKE